MLDFSNKYLLFCIAGFAVVFAVAYLQSPFAVFRAPDGSGLRCEIASTPEQRAAGLMNRSSLCNDCCMLFVFEESRLQSFWMKNTLIPLDLIFLDANHSIVDVKQNFQPCGRDPCEVYSSKAPAKYVVEVNAGQAAERKISEGSVLEVVLGRGH